MKIHDLRSDTVTKPTEGMRKAIAAAEVGDDVFHEDPTVNRLEALGAEITEKEESIFVSSGSMGNLLSLMINGGRGKEVLCAHESHIVQHEIGAVAAIANTIPIVVPSKDGIISPSELEKHIKSRSYDMAESAMIETENTTSGLIYPLKTLEEIKQIAQKHGMKVHLDGARIFNASVETGIPVSSYAKSADTITFCLSKGLGAPAGSLLSGSHEFIAQARRYRKLLGGGMRQIGILAAAGIWALEHHVERLKDDNEHARAIADALSSSKWAEIAIQGTNMIFFRTPGFDSGKVLKALESQGILALQDSGSIRFVTNLGISDEDTTAIVRIINSFDPSEARE